VALGSSAAPRDRAAGAGGGQGLWRWRPWWIRASGPWGQAVLRRSGRAGPARSSTSTLREENSPRISTANTSKCSVRARSQAISRRQAVLLGGLGIAGTVAGGRADLDPDLAGVSYDGKRTGPASGATEHQRPANYRVAASGRSNRMRPGKMASRTTVARETEHPADVGGADSFALSSLALAAATSPTLPGTCRVWRPISFHTVCTSPVSTRSRSLESWGVRPWIR
jgi:hypothetical protein